MSSFIPRDGQRPSGFLRLLLTLASLKLTVALFGFSLALVFVGTLAQVDNPTLTAVTDYFRSFFVFVPSQVFVRFFQAFRWVSPTTQWDGGFYFPGGWTIGFLMLANLLAAHAIRFKFNWKRSGILLIHSGLIILMLGELVTGLFAIEGNMTMEQGGTTNYLELRETPGFLGKLNGPELAFSDLSTPGKEKVVVIPNHLISNKGMISDPTLPFDIEVVDYMANSSISEKAPEVNPATKGDGIGILAVPKPGVSGTSTDQKFDIPSAYLKWIDKKTNQVEGVYLASVWLSLSSFKQTQEVTTSEGKKFHMALRLKRSYKPFQLELIEFKHERYLGTNTPKNFSSKIKLTDPSRNDSFETLISMNNPLRYEGETFYQSGFLPGDKGTILQVVRNPGWLIPYFSCVIVSLGMLIHFSMHLNAFMKQRGN